MLDGKLQGSIVALVTPMTVDGAVDWDALTKLLEWHIESGTHGIVPMGTTGESATLDTEEHLAVIKRTIEVVAGRVPVISAGCSISSIARRLGARSASRPSPMLTPLAAPTSVQGTGLVVWAVCGDPCTASHITSQLP